MDIGAAGLLLGELQRPAVVGRAVVDAGLGQDHAAALLEAHLERIQCTTGTVIGAGDGDDAVQSTLQQAFGRGKAFLFGVEGEARAARRAGFAGTVERQHRHVEAVLAEQRTHFVARQRAQDLVGPFGGGQLVGIHAAGGAAGGVVEDHFRASTLLAVVRGQDAVAHRPAGGLHLPAHRQQHGQPHRWPVTVVVGRWPQCQRLAREVMAVVGAWQR